MPTDFKFKTVLDRNLNAKHTHKNETRWPHNAASIVCQASTTIMGIKTLAITNAVIVAIVLVAGCSKSSSSPPQTSRVGITKDSPPDVKAFADLLTNRLEVLQQKYQEEDKQIQETQTKLQLLRQANKNTDQSYFDEQAKLDRMLAWHKMLWAKIQTMKTDAAH